MRERTTRDKGAYLEKKVSGLLPMFKPTNNSGAVSGNGDLQNNDFIIDCKNIESSDTISISKKELEKIRKQAQNYNKSWILIHRNKSGDITVTLDINDFVEIYDGFTEMLEESTKEK
jgi:hypothetical protein